jgi:hypothetical protein
MITQICWEEKQWWTGFALLGLQIPMLNCILMTIQIRLIIISSILMPIVFVSCFKMGHLSKGLEFKVMLEQVHGMLNTFANTGIQDLSLTEYDTEIANEQQDATFLRDFMVNYLHSSY